MIKGELNQRTPKEYEQFIRRGGKGNEMPS